MIRNKIRLSNKIRRTTKGEKASAEKLGNFSGIGKSIFRLNRHSCKRKGKNIRGNEIGKSKFAHKTIVEMMVVVRDDGFIAFKAVQAFFHRKFLPQMLIRVNGLKNHGADNRQHQHKIDYRKFFLHLTQR